MWLLELNTEQPNLLLQKRYLTNTVVQNWNNLSENTVSAPSVNSLKNKLDEIPTIFVII